MLYVDIFEMGLRKCKNTFCFVRLVSYELRYSKRLSWLEQKCICALGVRNKSHNGTDRWRISYKVRWEELLQ